MLRHMKNDTCSSMNLSPLLRSSVLIRHLEKEEKRKAKLGRHEAFAW